MATIDLDRLVSDCRTAVAESDRAGAIRDVLDRLAAGGRVLEAGDVCLLGPEAIHRVAADHDRYTGAIHVYAGDFFDRHRSTWSEETDDLVDDPRTPPELFAEAEAAWQARQPRT